MAKRKNVIPLRIDYIAKEIILYKWFAKKAKYKDSPEYHKLMEVVRDFPTYTIRIREDIKVNPSQEHYNGLNYDYMESYILKYESNDTVAEVMAEYENLKDISKCHSTGRRYSTLKKWFLKKYPEIAQFGMPELSEEETQENEEVENTLEPELPMTA